MSDLHLAQIRRVLEEQYIPHLNLEGADQDHHRLSRAVAALAIAERTSLPVVLTSQSVTDHTGDQGIDAVAYAADRSTLVLVQSKWSGTTGGLSQGDVLKFLNGVRKLVMNIWDDFDGPILQRRTEIADIVSQPGTKIELVLATTSTASLAPPQEDAVRSFCAEMNDPTEIATWIYLNQSRFYSHIAAAQDANINLSVTLRNWGTHQEGTAVAYYGTASAQEVVGWYEAHGSLLFSRNIRGALRETEVNEQMAQTAIDDASRFWFFNNGITVIAESFETAPHINQKVGSFVFRRASVVNGAQTVSSLSHAAGISPSLLETADIFVRFVTLDDPVGEFGRLVTRRTNTQNQVGGREFVSLDPEQERLRMEFAVSGFRYAYRSGESVVDPARGCDLTEATVALACAQGIREAVLVKREIGQLWSDISAPPYKSLFNPSVSGAQVWSAVNVLRQVEEYLRAFREDEFEGRDWLVSVHGNRLALWAVIQHLGAKKLKSVTEFTPVFDSEEILETTERIGRLIVSIVGEQYAESYPQPLFRNLSKTRDVGERLLAALAP